MYIKKKGLFETFSSKDLEDTENRRTFASSIRQKVIRFLG